MYVASAFSGLKNRKWIFKTTIHLAFDNPEIEQMTLTVIDKNQSAKNLYKKIGFVEYGRINNYMIDNGNYETKVFMTLLKSEKETTKR
ncbi:MAG: GNAT family N-acetyltransferase [Bacteroidetes bacterium]|nr:GNAT family N-acetyltransferase [Bacteroidota bacterium]